MEVVVSSRFIEKNLPIINDAILTIVCLYTRTSAYGNFPCTVVVVSQHKGHLHTRRVAWELYPTTGKFYNQISNNLTCTY